MIEEEALCDSIHDCTSLISSSYSISIFDCSRASSKLMTLFILESDSTSEGAVMIVGQGEDDLIAV